MIDLNKNSYIRRLYRRIIEDTGLFTGEIQNLIIKKRKLHKLASDEELLFLIAKELGLKVKRVNEESQIKFSTALKLPEIPYECEVIPILKHGNRSHALIKCKFKDILPIHKKHSIPRSDSSYDDQVVSVDKTISVYLPEEFVDYNKYMMIRSPFRFLEARDIYDYEDAESIVRDDLDPDLEYDPDSDWDVQNYYFDFITEFRYAARYILLDSDETQAIVSETSYGSKNYKRYEFDDPKLHRLLKKESDLIVKYVIEGVILAKVEKVDSEYKILELY